MYVISSKYALVCGFQTNTTYKIYLIDISGTTPVSLSNQTITHSTTSNNYQGIAIVKVSPWTFVADGAGSQSDGDYLFKLTPVSTSII